MGSAVVLAQYLFYRNEPFVIGSIERVEGQYPVSRSVAGDNQDVSPGTDRTSTGNEIRQLRSSINFRTLVRAGISAERGIAYSISLNRTLRGEVNTSHESLT